MRKNRSSLIQSLQILCAIAVNTVAKEEKKNRSLLKKEMFTSDTFLDVKKSCILVIRVVFKVQLKDLMTANTKNIFKN